MNTVTDHRKPFDALANARCDKCQRLTHCQGFEIPNGMRPLVFHLCVECLIHYAKAVSMRARGHTSISDLV